MFRFERESAIYLNAKQLKHLIIKGEWDEAEKYITRFASIVYDAKNPVCVAICELRIQKYKEFIEK